MVGTADAQIVVGAPDFDLVGGKSSLELRVQPWVGSKAAHEEGHLEFGRVSGETLLLGSNTYSRSSKSVQMETYRFRRISARVVKRSRNEIPCEYHPECQRHVRAAPVLTQ